MKFGNTVLGIIALFSTLQSSWSKIIPLRVGANFAVPFGDSDILRGFKKNVRRGESAFKAKPFSGTVKTRAFATEFVDSLVIHDQDDIKKSLEIGGELAITYGSISAEGGGRYVRDRIKTKKEITVVYTRRSAAYSKYVDLDTIEDSQGLVDLCGGPCLGSKMDAIAKKYGTKFIDQVIYGAQLDIIYRVKSHENIDEQLIEAWIKGSIETPVGNGVEFEASVELKDKETFENYKMTIVARATGVNFPVPNNPTFEEATEIIQKFNSEYEEILLGLSSLETIEEESNVLRKLTPVGFTMLSTSDYLAAIDPETAIIMDIKLTELGETFYDAIFRKQMLLAVMDEESLSRAFDDPRYRERRFQPYKRQAFEFVALLDDLIDACLDYREQPLDKIISGDPPRAIDQREDATLEKLYFALTGMGYIGPPLKIRNFAGSVSTYEQLYYTGFALQDRNAENFTLLPYFSGEVFDDNTEEIVARGNTTDDIYEKLGAIISPTGLPSDSIGYLTSFVMSLTNYTNTANKAIPAAYYTTAYDDAAKDFVPMTHLKFCDDSADTAQLQIAHKPEDLYDDQGIEKGQSECVRYGDIVFLAISFLSSGDIFLKVKDAPSDSWGDVEFGNPSAEGAKVKEFQWKIQSVIPFNGDPSLEDPLDGECVGFGDYTEYNVIFQNMEYSKRWFTGGRGDQTLRAETHANNIFEEGDPKNPPGYIGVYRWQLNHYEKARAYHECVDI